MSAGTMAGTVFAAVLAAAPLALAQEADKKKTGAPAMEMPKPAAEMSGLAMFEGTWTCTGQGAMEPGGAMMPMTSTVTSRSDMGGFWQAGTVKGTTPGMPPFEGMFHMTWDPGAKQYVMLWVDNMGGWSQATAPAAPGGRLVFAGTTSMGGKTMKVRDTFARTADGSLTHVGEMESGSGYVKMMDETCRKGGSR